MLWKDAAAVRERRRRVEETAAWLARDGRRRNEDAKAFRSANLAPFNGVDGLLLLLPREKC